MNELLSRMRCIYILLSNTLTTCHAENQVETYDEKSMS